MTARILVVDDIEANVRLLEAKLSAEYYEVISASDGPSLNAAMQSFLLSALSAPARLTKVATR